MRLEVLRVVTFLVIAIVLGASGAASALVLCTTEDGKTYMGDEPPPRCAVTKELTDSIPAELPTPVRHPTAARDPAAEQRAREGLLRAAEQNTEIDRRRHIRAITMQRMMNRTYANGRFIEGSVANGADFAVYGVRICIESGNFCQYMAPSTLQPGAQGTFSFPTNLMAVPDWRVMWDVVPDEAQ
jgi:hypothetical protein